MTLAERLLAADPEARLAAIADLPRDGVSPAECAALVACTGHERKAVQRRAADALAALAARGLPVRAALEPRLDDPAFGVRWGAAYALARLGAPAPALLPVLIEALGEDDGDVRWAAATILVGMRDRAGLEDTLRPLAREGNVAQRKMALYCLRDLAGPGDAAPAVAAVVGAALDDPAPPVRLAALAALPAVASDRAGVAPRVVGLLADPDAGVRRAAAAALGKLGVRSPAVLAALDGAATGEDPALARAASRARTLLGGAG